MQQWEYCELRLIVGAKYAGSRASLIFYSDPRRPWTPPDSVTAEHVAHKLGLDGWELVSVIAHAGLGLTGGPQIHWYFKRPVNAASK